MARSAGLLRIAQGATIVLMGLVAGPAGVVIAYLACYVAHGASNPMHTTLLHREVDSSHRTTVLSLNSMVGQPAGALGAILLAALADGDVDLDGDGRRGRDLRAGSAALHPRVAGRARPGRGRGGRRATRHRLIAGYSAASTQPSVRSTPLCQRAMPAARVASSIAGSQRWAARSIARSSSSPDQKPTARPAA